MSSERPVTELTFEQARTELEAIVAAIDDGAADLDTLSIKVARAGALLLHCRDRISATRSQVEGLVEAFEEVWTGTDPDTPGEPF